ncbi:sushi, von Willebrand factor type A, EGF and pentraxin domain-containing protein 1-like [Lineus longissimus]|uniref:sushi, von Willebrand factor type A, EGF and pentraxin domain-containing protein 1-like n=1 Tax=Lineus longissimus TaxID=88925 RepID=UPI002B4E6882
MMRGVFWFISILLVVMVIAEASGKTRSKAPCGTVKGVRNRKRQLIVFKHGKKFSPARFCGGRIFHPLQGLPLSMVCMYGKWYNQGQTYDINAIIGKAKYPCERILCKVPMTWFARFQGLSKSYRPGTQLHFTCPAMHKASNVFKQLGGKIFCQRGGNWNIGVLPLGVLCEAITCKWPPPERPLTRFKYPDKRDKFNLKAIYICTKRHGIKWSNGRWTYNLKIPCDHTTGKWRESSHQCEALRCQPPPSDLGKATTASNASVVTVSCKAPFVYSDGQTTDRSYECTYNKHGSVGFHIPDDVCQRCRSLPKIPEHLEYSLSAQNTRMDYRCEAGYEFYDGRAKRIALCTVYKGRQGWIPNELVTCHPVIPKCRDMPEVEHAIGERSGVVGTYTCEKGYVFDYYSGDPVKKVTCDPNKGWSAVTSCVKGQARARSKPTQAPPPSTEDPENIYNYF